MAVELTEPYYEYDGATTCHPLTVKKQFGHSRSSSNMSSDWDSQSYMGDMSPTRNSSKRSHKRGVSTFITKLYSMVGGQNQELITWSPNGTSFFIFNATKFSQEILPEHFKHSNFSSFVRQLNMYGFHKINKSPRGQRGNNENEIWEFSHAKFQYSRTDLLEDIRRKTLDSDVVRRDTGDIHSSFAVVQLSQSELMQQVQVMQESLSNVVQTIEEMKKVQLQQQIIIRRLLEERERNGDMHGQQFIPQHPVPTSNPAEMVKMESHATTASPQHVFLTSYSQPPVTHAPVFAIDTAAMHLASSAQQLPPSPANSDMLTHSRTPSGNQHYFSEPMPHHNTVPMNFA